MDVRKALMGLLGGVPTENGQEIMEEAPPQDFDTTGCQSAACRINHQHHAEQSAALLWEFCEAVQASPYLTWQRKDSIILTVLTSLWGVAPELNIFESMGASERRQKGEDARATIARVGEPTVAKYLERLTSFLQRIRALQEGSMTDQELTEGWK